MSAQGKAEVAAKLSAEEVGAVARERDSVARERDGFAAVLARFQRQLGSDMTRGLVSADYMILTETRIAALIEQIASGLHLVGSRPLDDPDPTSTDAPRVAAP